MPEPAAKRRPPQLELAPAPADLLVRIVSPIVALQMSSEMRNTLRLSHSIREEQNSLIAQNLALPSDGDRKSLPLRAREPASTSSSRASSRTSSPGNEARAAHLPAPDLRAPAPDESAAPAPDASAAPPSPGEDGDSDFARTSQLATRRLRRAKAPRPLRLVPGAPAPAIRSAPMRSVYSYRRVRPVLPPYSAVHLVPPSAGPVRRVVKAPAARRTVVQDVFHGAVAVPAPMHAQPLLAQRERFDDESLPEAPDPDARRPPAAVCGTITLNDEAAFNFKIYNDADAKRVFMEVCEKTWDRYVQSDRSRA